MDNFDQYNKAPVPFKSMLRTQGEEQLGELKQKKDYSVDALIDQDLIGAFEKSRAQKEEVIKRQQQDEKFAEYGLEPDFTGQTVQGSSAQMMSKLGPITQQFGNKNSIEKFSGGVNYGTDIAIPEGTELKLPPGNWQVVSAYGNAKGQGYIGNGENSGYGNSVLIRNADTGEMLRFSHLSRLGDLSKGIVGYSGSTGNATGAHLDLEYYDKSGRVSDVMGSLYRQYLGV